MSILETINFIRKHPASKNRQIRNVCRFLRWQIASRLAPGEMVIDFIENSRFVAKRGMRGITGNIYVGLHDFEDMLFLLHLLKQDELFVDVGANVGSYTILAATVKKARCLSVEPFQDTVKWLKQNIAINQIQDQVKLLEVVIGESEGHVAFSTNQDTMNHVVKNDTSTPTINLPMITLDQALSDSILPPPTLIKIDVEGYEPNVIAGASKTLAESSLLGVIMEVNMVGSEKQKQSASTMHQTMLNHSFKAYTYNPKERTLLLIENPNSSHNNTLYLKTKHVEEIKRRLQTAPKVNVGGNHI